MPGNTKTLDAKKKQELEQAHREAMELQKLQRNLDTQAEETEKKKLKEKAEKKESGLLKLLKGLFDDEKYQGFFRDGKLDLQSVIASITSLLQGSKKEPEVAPEVQKPVSNPVNRTPITEVELTEKYKDSFTGDQIKQLSKVADGDYDRENVARHMSGLLGGFARYANQFSDTQITQEQVDKLARDVADGKVKAGPETLSEAFGLDQNPLFSGKYKDSLQQIVLDKVGVSGTTPFTAGNENVAKAPTMAMGGSLNK